MRIPTCFHLSAQTGSLISVTTKQSSTPSSPVRQYACTYLRSTRGFPLLFFVSMQLHVKIILMTLNNMKQTGLQTSASVSFQQPCSLFIPPVVSGFKAPRSPTWSSASSSSIMIMTSPLYNRDQHSPMYRDTPHTKKRPDETSSILASSVDPFQPRNL